MEFALDVKKIIYLFFVMETLTITRPEKPQVTEIIMNNKGNQYI